MKPEELYKDVNQKQNKKLAIPDKSEGLWLQALHPVAAVKRNPQLYWPLSGIYYNNRDSPKQWNERYNYLRNSYCNF